MSTAHQALQTLLLGAAPVTALAGTRIAADRAEEDWPCPYVVYSGVTEPQRCLDGSTDGALTVFEIQAWADTRAAAEALADAVQNACDGAHQYITARAGGYDAELDLEAVVLTCNWWDD